MLMLVLVLVLMIGHDGHAQALLSCCAALVCLNRGRSYRDVTYMLAGLSHSE